MQGSAQSIRDEHMSNVQTLAGAPSDLTKAHLCTSCSALMESRRQTVRERGRRPQHREMAPGAMQAILRRYVPKASRGAGRPACAWPPRDAVIRRPWSYASRLCPHQHGLRTRRDCLPTHGATIQGRIAHNESDDVRLAPWSAETCPPGDDGDRNPDTGVSTTGVARQSTMGGDGRARAGGLDPGRV